MKIALVALQGSPFGHGAAGPDVPGRRLASLVTALAEQDNQVTLYARRDSADQPAICSPAPGVTVEHMTAGPAQQLPADKLVTHAAEFGRTLAERWGKDTPDVAHAHFWSSGLAALSAARGLRVPVVQTFVYLQSGSGQPGSAQPGGTGSYPLPATARQGGKAAGRTAGKGTRSKATASKLLASTARLRLEPVIARSVNAVLASSSTELSTLARLGVPRSALRLIPRGVDTVKFSPDGPAAPRGGRTRLLCVAPFSPQQGLDTAIRALAEIPDAELVIAGGPDRARLRNDKMYRSLSKLASELGVRSRLVFYGQIDEDGLPPLLRSADLLIDVASSEPFATVSLEAMACGLPVVASAVGSHRDTVIDGTTGILIPPGRPLLLAQRVRTLLASPMLLEGFGIAAVDRARSRYSWERIGKETLATYERSLGLEASAALSQ